MNCHIKVENGQAVGHPAADENLIDVYGQIPDGWEPLTLTDTKTLLRHPLKTYEGTPIYQLIDGVWTQVWVQVDKTPEEIAAYVEEFRGYLLNSTYGNNFTAWVFNYTTGKFEAPVPKPTDGHYKWHGPSNSFKEAPLKPTDDKNYQFNFYTWEWVEEV